MRKGAAVALLVLAVSVGAGALYLSHPSSPVKTVSAQIQTTSAITSTPEPPSTLAPSTTTTTATELTSPLVQVTSATIVGPCGGIENASSGCVVVLTLAIKNLNYLPLIQVMIDLSNPGSNSGNLTSSEMITAVSHGQSWSGSFDMVGDGSGYVGGQTYPLTVWFTFGDDSTTHIVTMVQYPS